MQYITTCRESWCLPVCRLYLSREHAVWPSLIRFLSVHLPRMRLACAGIRARVLRGIRFRGACQGVRKLGARARFGAWTYWLRFVDGERTDARLMARDVRVRYLAYLTCRFTRQFFPPRLLCNVAKKRGIDCGGSRQDPLARRCYQLGDCASVKSSPIRSFGLHVRCRATDEALSGTCVQHVCSMNVCMCGGCVPRELIAWMHARRAFIVRDGTACLLLRWRSEAKVAAADAPVLLYACKWCLFGEKNTQMSVENGEEREQVASSSRMRQCTTALLWSLRRIVCRGLPFSRAFLRVHSPGPVFATRSGRLSCGDRRSTRGRVHFLTASSEGEGQPRDGT